ncbi:glycosyl-transferase for dystroglycan-domain-containing protein [Zychaea mexicana]|uniref:glycosyl-transferase for dystroglycan-domain-containing protein n=1 Tax=Zychaea mexicana TaxID=64656 RepID=UPI0022FF3551|nr:glycosyl-transferase for dystroglycan-domain-containing protein [Zychaea mexicana]KAI9494528.1 glycosyl-transferase for dystroglycan-domain-containing protein [Zychaea mexicana]
MNRRLSTSRATIATGIHNTINDPLTNTSAATILTPPTSVHDNDEKKPKHPFPSTRRHFFNSRNRPSTSSRQQQPSILQQAHIRLSRHPKRLAFIALLLTIILFWIALTHSSSAREIVYVPLRDQPPYDDLLTKRQCTATLCNSENQCATWRPHHEQQHHHDAEQLKQEGMYCNVARIQVDLGCELLLKKADGTWMTITQGQQIDCVEQGCHDVVEADLQGDLYILASQLKQLIADPAYMDREIIVAHTGTQPSSSSDPSSSYDVTLVSQFSVNRLDVFTQVLDAWPGPVSVAIYLTEPNDVNQFKSFFAIPANVIQYSRVHIVVVKPDYTNPDRLKYPINHLRNLAITAATTSHVFVMDADFTPSANFYAHAHAELLSALGERGTYSRTAMVIPCYAILESHKDDPLPQNTAELSTLVSDGIAYITDPGTGHGPTLATSMQLLNGGGPDSLYYEVCYESQWEPYYIVPRETTPLYDARFRNQGGDKQSHALQLNALGFQFLVSNHAFILHKDHSKMQWPGGGFFKSQKEKTPWSYFGEFMREMEELYGSNVRWPRGCSANAIGWQTQLRNPLGMAIGA